MPGVEVACHTLVGGCCWIFVGNCVNVDSAPLLCHVPFVNSEILFARWVGRLRSDHVAVQESAICTAQDWLPTNGTNVDHGRCAFNFCGIEEKTVLELKSVVSTVGSLPGSFEVSFTSSAVSLTNKRIFRFFT